MDNHTESYNYNELKRYEEQLDENINYILELSRKNIMSELTIPILKALAWIVGGVLISYWSYIASIEEALVRGNSTYFVWWGAVLYGIIRLIIIIKAGVDEYEYSKQKILEQKQVDITLWKQKRI